METKMEGGERRTPSNQEQINGKYTHRPPSGSLCCTIFSIDTTRPHSTRTIRVGNPNTWKDCQDRDSLWHVKYQYF